MNRNAIIICNRIQSSRIKRKSFASIGGWPLLRHLITRLLPAGLPIILAVPHKDQGPHEELLLEMGFGDHDGFTHDNRVTLFSGNADDPLARMAEAAKAYDLSTVVRVCSDKIFVEPVVVQDYVRHFHAEKLDYLYSSGFTPGTGFEVISRDALELAAIKHKNVEHISYAIRTVTDKIKNMPQWGQDVRLLVDYPKDLVLLRKIIRAKGLTCSLNDALRYLRFENPKAKEINRLPIITFYTCAYNAAPWIRECMASVAKQKIFPKCEYILVDDKSTDKTLKLMKSWSRYLENVFVVENEKNLGLASSSNIALARARGKYIMRVDADDYLVGTRLIEKLITKLEKHDADVVFPAFFTNEKHRNLIQWKTANMGGALFETRAVNYIKFTDGLRGYDGLDFFSRAKDKLKTCLGDEATYFYRQRPDSLSHTNTPEREKIRQEIEARG